MTANRKIVIVSVGLGVLALIALPVLAHCGKCAGSCKEYVAAMDANKVTLATAIAAAEDHSKGKACGAHCHTDAGKFGFHVYCVVGDKLMQVDVDGMGKATKMEEAKDMPTADHKAHGVEKPAKPEKKEEPKPGSPG